MPPRRSQNATNRAPIRYGYRVTLFCESRSGYVVSTNSAMAPVGVRDQQSNIDFERCVFTIVAGDSEVNGGQTGEEIKFGQVVRLVHNTHYKPICHNTTMHSFLNKANQRVTLDRCSTSSTDRWDRWRIMPRYRVRGEGEVVCGTDHIILQSSIGDGLYLHVSSQRDNAIDDCYEVNCGSVAEGFEVRIYDADLSSNPQGESIFTRSSLRGGTCVVLHHKEKNRRVVAHPQHGYCSLDAVEASLNGMYAHNYHTLFVLEFQDNQVGGLVQPGHRHHYRLKALSNGAYLCVRHHHHPHQARGGGAAGLAESTIIGDEAVFLTTDVSNPGTLFVFHQAGDDQASALKNGSRVYIESPNTTDGGGLWLVAGVKIDCSLTDITQITTPVRMSLTSHEEKSMGDGFELQRLQDDEYEELSVVLSLLPPLRAYVHSLRRGELDSSKVSQVLENTRFLRRMCFLPTDAEHIAAGSEVDGCPNPLGQHRLLRQGVAELCLEIVSTTLHSSVIDSHQLHSAEVIPASMPNVDPDRRLEIVPVKYTDILELLNSCFALVVAVVKGHPQHAVELGKYIELIVGSCRTLPAALECAAEFYRGNLTLVDTPNDSKTLEVFLTLLMERGRDTAVLEVVTLFAAVGSVGLPDAQQLICDRLLRNRQVAKHLLIPITSTSGVLHVGVPSCYGVLRNERSSTSIFDDPSGSEQTMSYIPMSRTKDLTGGSYACQGRNGFLSYFQQQISLFAALCQGRNAQACALTSQFVPSELMLPLIQSTDIPHVLRAAFLELFTVSFVNVSDAPDLEERTTAIRHVVDRPLSTDSYVFEHEQPLIVQSAKDYTFKLLEGFHELPTKISQLKELRSMIMLLAALARRGAIAMREYLPLMVQLSKFLDRTEKPMLNAQDAISFDILHGILGLFNTLCDFHITREVYSVVITFIKGLPYPSSGTPTQLVEFQPTMGENERIGSSAAARKRLERLRSIHRILTTLMSVAQMDNPTLRSEAVHVFCRMTNHPGELLLACERVQLLTSSASTTFYNQVKSVALDLSALLAVATKKHPFANLPTTLPLLDRVVDLLLFREYGALIEKIAMIRHVGIPQLLISLLHQSTFAPPDEVRSFVFSVVGLLRTMAQDELVLELLFRRIDEFVGLAPHDMDIISLLRTIFEDRPNHTMNLPQSVVDQLVRCFSLPHAAEPAVQLIRMILQTKDSAEKYVARNQRLVWKSIVADPTALQLFRLRGVWTGKFGQPRRDSILCSHESYNVAGELQMHLARLELLVLIAHDSDLVKPEEVRSELFGPNGVEDLVEVVTNESLPAFYRWKFVKLLQVLVVDDPGCAPSFFSHRRFGSFLSLCHMDVLVCLQMIRENDVVKDAMLNEAMKMFHHSLRLPPSNEFEEAIDARRRSPNFYCQFLVDAVLPCMSSIIDKFDASSSRINQQLRAELTIQLNQFVDGMCDFVRQTFVLPLATEIPVLEKYASRIEIRQMLKKASAHKFVGLGLWSEDIDQLITAVPDHRDEVAAAVLGTASTQEKALTTKWIDFMKSNFAEHPIVSADFIFSSAAGAILRSGVIGTQFVLSLLSCLAEKRDSDAHDRTSSILHLLRQVASLRPNAQYDDSSLLPFPKVPPPTEALTLRLEDEPVARQSAFAKFRHKQGLQIVPIVTRVLSEQPQHQQAALEFLLVALHDGHAELQSSLMQFLLLKPDENLFIYLRNELMGCRETVRAYLYARRRGINPNSANFFKRLEVVHLELRFIQLLCEGHFTALQQYLRSQPDNNISVNVLESLVDLLAVVVDIVDVNTADFVIQLINTITETMQGPCRSNQDYFVVANVAEHLSKFVKLPLGHGSLPSETVQVVRSSASIALLALLEGRMETSFISALVHKVDLTMLIQAMEQSTKEYESKRGKLEAPSGVLARSLGIFRHFIGCIRLIINKNDDHDELTDELCVAINIFIFFKICIDVEDLTSYRNIKTHITDKNGLGLREALRTSTRYKELRERVGSVELLRGNTIERGYFRILSSSSENLRESSKREVIKNVGRSSDNRRLQDFADQCQLLLRELDYYAEMRKAPLLSFIHDYASEFDVLGLLIVFVINLIMISTYRADEDIYTDAVPSGVRGAVDVLGIILIVFQLLLFLNVFFGPTRIHLQSCWHEWQEERVAAVMEERRRTMNIEIVKEDDLKFLEKVSLPQYYVMSVLYILQYGKFWQLALFVVASILGYVQTPVWYTIQLLQITTKSQVLFNVVLAVTTNGTSLLFTFALLLFVIYVFSSIAFYYFSELMGLEDAGLDCSSLLSCWFRHIDSIRAGGGIGDRASAPDFYTADATGYSFFAFRILFFIIVIVIFLNIVFGIIVDTFAQLRENREFIKHDQMSKCFVCGVEQNDFDRVVAGGFEQHTISEHNMWQYLFYMHYLMKKSPDLYNGQESHVAAKLKLKESTFFPIGRALMLQAQVLEEEQDMPTVVSSSIETAVEKVNRSMEMRFDELHGRIEKLENRVSMEGSLRSR